MENKIHFEKLTLNENVDIKVYEDALNFAFESPDIKNIAISGAYGAGKSSVLASYKKKYPDKKYMHISLAHFEEEIPVQQNNNSGESILEGKVLNQLIHQLSLDDVPQTNFKIKQNMAKSTIVRNTIFIALFLLSVLFIKFHNEWIDYVNSLSDWLRRILEFTQFRGTMLISVAISITLSILFIYQIVKTQKSKRFLKKLTFQGNEIEIFEDKDESYFDKYLNEVLYLFENCNVDVIVFEDMDRFEMNHIFERLREINTLVNIQLNKREDKKVLRFFYLLRDDVFVSKDRTKFFDYIIPIVPVLDGTNSYDQFISHLEKNDMLCKLNEKFLQGLSLYVDDMRLLKNICNEFLVYYNRVNTTELDYDKMLALITYKNLFPRDFSELQLGRGFVHSLFAQKEQFVELEVDQIKQLIEEKKKDIQQCNNEQLKCLEELELVKKDRETKANAYTYDYSLRNRLQKEYKEWKEQEYPKRKKAIEDKVNNNQENIQKEIDDLNFKCIKIHSCPLKDLITRENIDEIFKNTSTTNEIGQVEEYKEIKGSEYFDILKYLIRNGYIDETYADYMTYFYENSLSRVDKIFLRSVTDKKAKEYSYELKNPELVVSRLDVSDFEEKETLNFHLLKYLFESKPDSIQLKRILKQISQNNNLDFMRQFLNYFNEWDFCVSKINILWPQFFKQMLENGSFDTQMIHKYSVCTFYNSSLDDISNININNCLKEYIEDSPGYLNIGHPKVNKLILAFEHLNIKFKDIDFTVSDKELFREVYRQSLYELNFGNIKLMLTIMEQFATNEEIVHQNYTLILNAKKSPLYVYVNSNIEQYAQEMLDNCEERIDDGTNVAVAFINNTNISQELKCKYIEYLNTTVDSLNLVEDTSLWEHCLDKGVVEFTENNIVLYYFTKEVFDLSLVNYINSFSNKINMDKVNLEDDKASQMFNACVKCVEINNEKYKQFLTSMHRSYHNNFSVQNISNDKMKILIDEKIIRFTTASLNSLRENYDADICYHYIKKNFDAYIENMTTEFFSFEELIEILEWDVSDAQKIELLNFTSKPISIVAKTYSVNIKLHILQNNLCDEDIIYLRENYDIQEKQIRDFVLENAAENIDDSISHANKISYLLLCDLFRSEEVYENKKIELFLAIVPTINKEQCLHIFNTMGRTDFASIFEPKKKPKFLVSNNNLFVLEQLKQKGWIYEYYVDATDNNYYRIRRNKPIIQKLK